jgi:hypothetical protein
MQFLDPWKLSKTNTTSEESVIRLRLNTKRCANFWGIHPQRGVTKLVWNFLRQPVLNMA